MIYFGMKLKQQILSLLTALLFLSCANPSTPLLYHIDSSEHVYSSALAQEVSMDKMIDYLDSVPVLFVGDYHDSNKTHDFFNELLIKLAQRGFKLHLANEWFTPYDDEILARYVHDDINISSMMNKTEFKKRIYFDANLSTPLYETIKSHRGELYGINMDKNMRKKISLKQEQNMSVEELSFYSALELDVAAHKALVSPYFAHCELYKKKSVEACKERMYRVQVAWDSYMAQQSVKLSKEVLKTPKDKLIVFAGAMHMEYGLGIPLRFSRLSALDFKIITNYALEEEEEMTLPLGLADFIYIYK